MPGIKLNQIFIFACVLGLLAVSAMAQKVETVYHFHTDPANPEGVLVPADDESFYFSAQNSLLKIEKTGIVTKLFAFNSIGAYSQEGGLIKDQNGVLYGVSRYGISSYGTVFRYIPGENPVLLATFSQTNGAYPVGKLLLAKDGNLYGATYMGGSQNSGVIFKLTPSGILTPLLSLNDVTGRNPVGLVNGDDDSFYGLTSSPSGTVFRIDTSGVFTILHSFGGKENCYPRGPLVKGPKGDFYGIGIQPGLMGTKSLCVYKITPSGIFTIVASLTETTATSSNSGYITLSKDGNFYSVTPYGGTNDSGIIFKMTPEGVVTILVNLDSKTGFDARGELVESNDGNFYGTLRRGGPTDWGTVFKMTPLGDFTIIRAFNSIAGKSPTSILPGPGGNFYGTTALGGTNSGNGIFFKMTPKGVVTTVCSLDPTNGTYQTLKLIQKDGNAFYLTTQNRILKITPDGQTTNFFTLSGVNLSLIARLISGSDGNMYGLAQSGGEFGFGFIFQLTPARIFTRLGSFPQSGYGTALLEGVDGNFYGTTSTGGIYGVGTIYKMTPAGQFTPVASFKPTGARSPNGTLIQSADGTIYGTGSATAERSYGAIFKLSAPGVPATVSTFENIAGSFPAGDLIRAVDGNLYGTIAGDGFSSSGSIFRLTTEGQLSTLFSFDAQPSGSSPIPLLTAAPDGNLYGVASGGGLYGEGTIYRVAMTPSLKIDRNANSFVFSWPTNFPAFNLQSSPNVESTTWSNENKTPSIKQDQYTLTNSPLENMKFFRLSK